MNVHIYTLRYNPVSGGGSHHTLDIFIRALTTHGHTPILTTFFSDDNNYKQKPCEMREEYFTGGFFALQRHVAGKMRENTDAHIHLLYSSYLLWAGGVYKRNGGMAPVVASINNYTPGMGLNRPAFAPDGFVSNMIFLARHHIHRMKWYAWEKLAGIRLVRKIDRFYFDSPVIEGWYRRFGYSARSSLVIPAPMEHIPETHFPTPFQSGAGIFNIIFAGRLITDKGPDLLVKAALRLPRNIHVHFIGSGNEEARLKTFVEDNNLSERVFFYGWKNPAELSPFYRNADIFVQPSRWPEPFGRTTADAMACGLPVVATEDSGPAWVAGNGGITFKKDSVDDLAKCILFYFNNLAERVAYAKKATTRARLFDADAVSSQFVTDIESLVKKS